MRTSRAQQIEDAIASRQLMRIERRFEDAPILGHVLAAGPRFFLVAVVSDQLWYDGFECFRIADVRAIAPDRYGGFAEAALKLRGERTPRRPRVDLASTRALLDSAGARYPLVTIHREMIEPDICRIGRVVSTTASRVTLLQIAPDARWDATPIAYPLSGITRVDFGGDYEDALWLVGAPAPA